MTNIFAPTVPTINPALQIANDILHNGNDLFNYLVGRCELPRP